MKKKVVNELINILQNLNIDIKNVNINISSPKNKKFGDLSTNISFQISKILNQAPMEVANKICNEINNSDSNLFTKVDAIEPGFINFYLNPIFLNKSLLKIIKKADDYGKNTTGKNQKVLVEFVSANPTGPLTVGHGRGAIIGDVISNIFKWNGYDVDREYYYNNAGRQMRILGESVKSRYLEIINENSIFPEDGYHGEYIKDIAKKLYEKDKNLCKNTDNNVFKNFAEKFVFNEINNTLKNLGINFNSFFNENSLYENKDIYNIIDKLKEKGLIYNKDNATWFKGTAVGRESDRVLVKSSGEPTYRLPDMAYHVNKLDRGFDLCIDVFGADHMDAYPDVLEVVHQLGYDKNKINVLIHQFISIVDNGKPVKMSTRKANFITLDQLINETNKDVVRYFFIMRSMNSHLNFDLGVAKEKSEKNPVYYIQYAYARISNINNNVDFKVNNANLDLLNDDAEIKLISKINDFEELILKIKKSMEPQNLATYLHELSAMFHKYYAKHRIINNDLELSKARIILINSIAITIKNGLEILGISAPKRM